MTVRHAGQLGRHGGAPPREPRRVLIIDAYDEREMYAEAFRAGGFAVVTARTAAEGLVGLGANQPHVVVQGMALPDLSGLELVREIKARARTVPVVAITGFTDERSLRLISGAGFAAVMLKPCLPRDLLRTVTKLARAVTRGPRRRDPPPIPDR